MFTLSYSTTWCYPNCILWVRLTENATFDVVGGVSIDKIVHIKYVLKVERHYTVHKCLEGFLMLPLCKHGHMNTQIIL